MFILLFLLVNPHTEDLAPDTTLSQPAVRPRTQNFFDVRVRVPQRSQSASKPANAVCLTPRVGGGGVVGYQTLEGSFLAVR